MVLDTVAEQTHPEEDVEGATTQSVFRRRAHLPETAESRRLVLRAVARARDGDSDALRLLYVRYADSVYAQICGILRNEHDAEDVTQQVFGKITTSLASYQQRDVPFRAWLLRVARNAAIDHLRAQRCVPCEDVRPAGETQKAGSEGPRDLLAALHTLPERQREVMILRHIVGLSPPEIAGRIAVSESSVHGLHHRARAALQAELERLDAAPTTKGSYRGRERRTTERRRLVLHLVPTKERRRLRRRFAAA